MSDISFAERRRANRHSIERRVKLLVESDRTNTHRDAVTVDVGTLGARVLSDARLSPGQSVDLIVNQDAPVILSAQVVWVDVTEASGTRQAGLEFTDPGNIPLALLAPIAVRGESA
ncbi:MAG TPA: PilZ domain-containing protein [Terriglobia bacterium]|nr:PilZ domain-containing protein [Terriglobia bacterium]